KADEFRHCRIEQRERNTAGSVRIDWRRRQIHRTATQPRQNNIRTRRCRSSNAWPQLIATKFKSVLQYAERQFRTEISAERIARLDDARLDHHLTRRYVRFLDQRTDFLQFGWNIG